MNKEILDTILHVAAPGDIVNIPFKVSGIQIKEGCSLVSSEDLNLFITLKPVYKTRYQNGTLDFILIDGVDNVSKILHIESKEEKPEWDDIPKVYYTVPRMFMRT